VNEQSTVQFLEFVLLHRGAHDGIENLLIQGGGNILRAPSLLSNRGETIQEAVLLWYSTLELQCHPVGKELMPAHLE
jgi:hypothetical protein